jgi:hypothetical protein
MNYVTLILGEIIRMRGILGACAVAIVIVGTGCGNNGGGPIAKSVATQYAKGPAGTVCVSTRTLVKDIKSNAIKAYSEGSNRRALAVSAREIAVALYNGARRILTLEHNLPDKGDARVVRRMRKKSLELQEYAGELTVGAERRASTANYVVFLSLTVNPLNDC